jgi:hypothetical protein
MAAPSLTHAFTVYVLVSVPSSMGPGNENASLTVLDGVDSSSYQSHYPLTLTNL